jgi:hypothetical protein
MNHHMIIMFDFVLYLRYIQHTNNFELALLPSSCDWLSHIFIAFIIDTDINDIKLEDASTANPQNIAYINYS